jgi:hypothetical protein
MASGWATAGDDDLPAPQTCADVIDVAKTTHWLANKLETESNYLEKAGELFTEFERAFGDTERALGANAAMRGESPDLSMEAYRRRTANIRKATFIALSKGWEWRERSESAFIFKISGICNDY